MPSLSPSRPTASTVHPSFVAQSMQAPTPDQIWGRGQGLLTRTHRIGCGESRVRDWDLWEAFLALIEIIKGIWNVDVVFWWVPATCMCDNLLQHRVYCGLTSSGNRDAKSLAAEGLQLPPPKFSGTRREQRLEIDSSESLGSSYWESPSNEGSAEDTWGKGTSCCSTAAGFGLKMELTGKERNWHSVQYLHCPQQCFYRSNPGEKRESLGPSVAAEYSTTTKLSWRPDGVISSRLNRVLI